MDIGKLLQRAWEITWRHKILWAFGLVIALTAGGGSGGGSGAGYRFERADWSPMRMPEAWVIVLLALLALLLVAAAVVLTTIAQGALIEGARQAEREGEVKGSAAWRKGTGRFWPLLGIRALLFVVVVVLVMPLMAMVLLTVLPAQSGAAVGELGIALAICGAALCCLPLLPIGIALALITAYADRACVLDGLGVIEALKKGWETLKDNLGPTLLVGVILLAIQMLIGIVFAGGLAAVAMPAGGMWAVTRDLRAAAVPICCLGLLWGLLSLAVRTVLQTFVSSAWTLAYLGLQKGGEAAAPVAMQPVEPQPAAE